MFCRFFGILLRDTEGTLTRTRRLLTATHASGHSYQGFGEKKDFLNSCGFATRKPWFEAFCKLYTNSRFTFCKFYTNSFYTAQLTQQKARRCTKLKPWRQSLASKGHSYTIRCSDSVSYAWSLRLTSRTSGHDPLTPFLKSQGDSRYNIPDLKNHLQEPLFCKMLH